ncbi:MAG: ATP-binding cassette domain-containing protein [Pirellulaceae bacterium]|nr:ATP-binding cassette domain-containing protein [Pirellulaceae bacterium]
MNTSSILLECRDLQRHGAPGGSPLLQGITLQLRAGDRCGMVGKSGSGKSLLLRGLARLDARTTGLVKYRDQSSDELGIPQFRKHVLYLTQHSTLLPGSVEENLKLPFHLAGRRTESFDRDSLIMQLSDLSRDETFLEKPVSDLSGGEARIVAVLRALQLKANVLLLDEPTSSLDDETARGVERLVDTWISEEPARAYLWVTHSLHQARRVTDRVWEMHSGRLQSAS